MDKRTILAIVLSILVLFTYQTFFVKPPPPKKPDTATVSKESPVAPSANKVSGVVPERKAPLITKLATASATVPEKEITVDTKLYRAVFTTKGGTLKSFKL